MTRPAPHGARRPLRAALAVVLVGLAQAAQASAAPIAPAVVQPTKDQRVVCRTQRYRDARRAVNAWCESAAPVKRPYYRWSLARTKHHACDDLRAAFAGCADILREVGLEGEDGSFVVADLRGGDVTYWSVSLQRTARTTQVAAVDFYEDCTGP